MPLLRQRIQERRELLEGPAHPGRIRPDGLTPREVDVLRLVARGFTNAEIAERLFISPLTVAKHVHNLLEKTGMANRTEAAAYAARGALRDG
jgi:DNA-binding NarL/FixJ family response regulator